MLLNLNLLVLRCRDLDASRRFYECLGLSFEMHAHGSGPEHLASENPDGVLELYPLSETTADIRDSTGLGFLSHNLMSLSAELSARGFTPQPPRDQSWGRTFVVRDPDGRRVEIKEISVR